MSDVAAAALVALRHRLSSVGGSVLRNSLCLAALGLVILATSGGLAMSIKRSMFQSDQGFSALFSLSIGTSAIGSLGCLWSKMATRDFGPALTELQAWPMSDRRWRLAMAIPIVSLLLVLAVLLSPLPVTAISYSSGRPLATSAAGFGLALVGGCAFADAIAVAVRRTLPRFSAPGLEVPISALLLLISYWFSFRFLRTLSSSDDPLLAAAPFGWPAAARFVAAPDLASTFAAVAVIGFYFGVATAARRPAPQAASGRPVLRELKARGAWWVELNLLARAIRNSRVRETVLAGFVAVVATVIAMRAFRNVAFVSGVESILLLALPTAASGGLYLRSLSERYPSEADLFISVGRSLWAAIVVATTLSAAGFALLASSTNAYELVPIWLCSLFSAALVGEIRVIDLSDSTAPALMLVCFIVGFGTIISKAALNKQPALVATAVEAALFSLLFASYLRVEFGRRGQIPSHGQTTQRPGTAGVNRKEHNNELL
jgi:hypothetical protein